jgi:S1 RNA binding domain protein
LHKEEFFIKKEIVVGSVMEGVITGITKFGAFVELAGGTTGLVHISEIADEYVKDINELFKKSDKVKVKVLTVENSGKIGLSIRQAVEGYKPVKKGGRSKPAPVNKASFEDKMNRFLKESDERLLDLKRNTESKRGGGRGSFREAF